MPVWDGSIEARLQALAAPVRERVRRDLVAIEERAQRSGASSEQLALARALAFALAQGSAPAGSDGPGTEALVGSAVSR